MNPNSAKFPVYMDYNATTPLDPLVINEISRSLKEDWGNPSSSHALGVQAKTVIRQSRTWIARMLNATSDDILFVSGGTEANNLSILSTIASAERSFAATASSCKPHVICSNVEHDSVIRVLRQQEALGKIDLSTVNVGPNGVLNPDDVLSHVQSNTCLISVMHANNESGVIMPIEEIGNKLEILNADRARNGLPKVNFHCDAAQTIGKIRVDVQRLKVDFLTVVGHKFYGPRIGALFVRNLLQDSKVLPLFQGGGQENGFRPGTENTPMIAGLGKAAELVHDHLEEYQQTMSKITNIFIVKLKEEIPDIGINFRDHDRNDAHVETLPNTVSICLPEGLCGFTVLNVGCKGKLMASLGAACHSDSKKPSGILIASGLTAEQASRTIRLSIGRNTTDKDVECVVNILKESCVTKSP